MIEGYCWPQSALPGETIGLYCHSKAENFQLEVIRQGAQDKTVQLIQGIGCKEQDIGANAATTGCSWNTTLDLTIDPAWSSGFYLARLTDSDGGQADAFFVVRAKEPADALLVLSTSTWNAYNTWGGLSYYTGGHVVSPKRPLPPGFLAKDDPHRHRIARFKDWPKADGRAFAINGYDSWSMAAGWANWELLFVRWAEAQGYHLGFATSQDLDQNPNLLDGYPAYLFVGHDEYWSAGMRNNVEDFIDAGGRAAFLSGNTSFWQVRFSHDYQQMTSYKSDMRLDPLFNAAAGPGELPDLATMWADPLVGRPENQMTGVSFTRGGYARMPNSPNGTGGYTVWQPDHWAFQSTNLKAGNVLGAAGMVVGYECDGCELSFAGERPAPTHADATPKSFELLGSAPARLWETAQAPGELADNFVGELNWLAERFAGEDTAENRARFAHGHAVLGIFKRGKGEVFTTGCTDWAYGLRGDDVATVTRNVLDRFIKAN